MSCKRRLNTKKNLAFWATIDKIARGRKKSEKCPSIGDPWTDSHRDVSASLAHVRW